MTDIQEILDQDGELPVLIAGRHKSTGAIIFPNPGGDYYESMRLGRRGKVWSHTVQRFPPKSPPYKGINSPTEFEPYCLGYVEIPGETIVQTRFHVDEPDQIKIGQDVELVLIPFATNSADGPSFTYAFQPCEPDQ